MKFQSDNMQFSPTFQIFSPILLVQQNAFIVRQNAIQSDKLLFSPTKYKITFLVVQIEFLVRKKDETIVFVTMFKSSWCLMGGL
jgi:hypothetical protein